MSTWEILDMDSKILTILQDVPDSADGHHLGRAYLTAYQLAIEFRNRHPGDVEQIGYPIGGVGTGQRNSFSQYIAQQLSIRIRSGRLPEVEGGFLSNLHLKGIHFLAGEDEITSSLTGSGFTLSMFRLRNEVKNQ